MTDKLFSRKIQCPYCWETIEVLIDDCGEDQQYVEDCQVCCRPINFHLELDDSQQIQVSVFTDDE